MGKINHEILSFNRGIISPLALARVDLSRTRLSAETQTNYIPRVLGAMSMRPGLEYLASTENNNSAIHIPFIFSTTDTAILQISNQNLRVIVDDEPISRSSVSASITNSDFASDISGWTDADEGSAASTWNSGGYMALLGTGIDTAARRQKVSVTESGTKHALRIVIERGPVEILVGATSGGSQYFSETLRTGIHSLAFTPTSDFWIEFRSALSYTVLVDEVSVEGSGTVDIGAPWLEDDLNDIRWAQSADVVFIAAKGYKQRRIERRGQTSWSVVEYDADDGPFRTINTTSITLTPSALEGDISLTASSALFSSKNVGSLYRIESIGQKVEKDISSENVFTDAIRVTGVDQSRVFDIDISGTFTATITVQRSVGEEGDWADVPSLSYTGSTSTTHDDGLDNQIVFYRIGIKTGDYTSGTATATLTYGSGSNVGVVRITKVNSSTSANAVTINALGGTDGSSNWYEGEWSARRGYPSAVAFHEGRLGWSGKGKIWLSATDAYESFDPGIEGDSGPINRNIGEGPVDKSNWMFSSNRLLVGTDGSEISIRSSSLDEPLTPTAFNIRFPSTLGSANVPIAKIDKSALFVQRSQTEVYRMAYNESSFEYEVGKETTLVPEIGSPGIERIAVQRQPDTRVHCVRSDGKVALLVSDPAEDVTCWVLLETDGDIEDVVVLPDTSAEDRVYYLVKRTINGQTKRYLEKWALESEAQGGNLNKQADSFITYSGTPTTTVSGLDHLEAESVVVWADGQYNGEYTVSGGQITLSSSASDVVVGLSYTAKFKSVKLAYAAQWGTALNQIKRVDHIGVILRNTYKDGVKYGPDFDNLDDLPDINEGERVSDGTVHSDYDETMFEFNGVHDTDSRICLQSQAPKPATILAITVGIQTNEKI